MEQMFLSRLLKCNLKLFGPEGDRIHADVFQTSRTDTTIELTKVDGKMVYGLEFLTFDVKSCSKVQLSINMGAGRTVMDIYPNKTSHMQYCESSTDTCTEEILVISKDMCDGYTPLWVKVSYYDVIIGEGCEAAEVGLWSYFSYWNIESIKISSVDDAWWRFGESSCQPVTTQATTTKLTTQPATTPVTATETTPEVIPEATSQTPGSLINETLPKNMGRSAGAVRSSSFTGMIIVVTLQSYKLMQR
ncbi:uncharacterized protein [Haliotis asinina]|uniref:uncharacterized protein n=1 Tax=Haliotis asinina TaxID=109174 RepID=UPI0035326FD9